MDSPIYITPQDIINIVLALCGAIITVSGAGTIIIRAIGKLREPDKKQNERLSVLEEQIKDIYLRLEAGSERFRDDNARMERIEIKIRTSIAVMIQSLQALTDHAIDGNNTEALHEAKKDMNKFLRNQDEEE